MRGSRINIRKYIEAIKPYLQLGYGIDKACDYAGIPAKSVWNYYNKDEAIGREIDYLKATPNILSRKNWVGEIQNKNYNASKDWLERHEPEEFAPPSKVQLMGKDGGAIQIDQTVDVKDLSLDELNDRIQKKLTQYNSQKS